MKVVSVEEMRQIDVRAQQDYGIHDFELMEAAGRGISELILDEFAPETIAIVCGKGNNAGDGFVIARNLHEKGCDVQVFCMEEPDAYRGAAQKAWGAMPAKLRDASASSPDAAQFSKFDLIVDALLGTGISGAPRREYAKAITSLNASGRRIVAVDVPSGLQETDGDSLPGEVVRATMTATVGLPKKVLLTLPGSSYVGDLRILPINFPVELLTSPEWKLNWARRAELQSWLPPRRLDSNKGTWGNVGIIGSKLEYAGATALVARGALRAGCGLATIYTLPAANSIYKTLLPEATSVLLGQPDDQQFTPLAAEDFVSKAREHQVLIVGPGFGDGKAATECLLCILTFWRKPIILDADALNLIADGLMPVLRNLQHCLVTPHPGEMARLLGTSVRQIQADREAAARRFAQKFEACVLLKGAGSLLACPDGQTWLIPGSEPALAKGGTGDVLAGIIAGLFAQGMELWQAAVLAATVHLEAGQICARKYGSRGVLASEVADEIPHVLDMLESSPLQP